MSSALPGEVFIPNGDSRQETAILLVGTADEYGIPQREIRASALGFFVSQRLAEIAYPENKKTTRSSKKTSGNRAAKTGTDKE